MTIAEQLEEWVGRATAWNMPFTFAAHTIAVRHTITYTEYLFDDLSACSIYAGSARVFVLAREDGT